MKVLRIIALLAAFLLLVSVSYAHPGGTDSSGGHYVGGTAEYHYHHSYEAHSHWDMDGDGDLDCPYDFKDNTESSSPSFSDKEEAIVPDIKKKRVSGDVLACLVCLAIFGVCWLIDKFCR